MSAFGSILEHTYLPHMAEGFRDGVVERIRAFTITAGVLLTGALAVHAVLTANAPSGVVRASGLRGALRCGDVATHVLTVHGAFALCAALLTAWLSGLSDDPVTRGYTYGPFIGLFNSAAVLAFASSCAACCCLHAYVVPEHPDVECCGSNNAL